MNTKITILEDDIDIREICTYILMEEGYSVESFSDIASFNASPKTTDLFLLDIRLPDGNGLEVCEQLKNDPKTKSIPIIMMSAHYQNKSGMLICKADDFIEKPFDIANLLQRIAKQLPD